MILLIIIIFLVIYTYKTHKNLTKRKNRVNESWIRIENLIKNRNDMILSLIEVAGEYNMKKDTINNIKNTRSNLLSSKKIKDKMTNSNKLSDELSYLFALTEDYPDLKVDRKFLDIQSKIHDTEDQINNTKIRYNKLALDYKNKINFFPSKIVAYIFKFKPAEIFSEEKANIEEIEVLEF